ncbi:putative SOS response-associated peptidase YedK [Palleronia aestuarii]|uniref:Abasic site processing protein n=1 Tax=Palleronia aestuarii TaxID=568105 RepID=A0A2W7MVX3_9RHOB|nr:SOS response-associated peptidase [Palleronia aestuarii]PZX11791.1 putative SOS response-associated peptidase YedK [Palleronia aestuarii]
MCNLFANTMPQEAMRRLFKVDPSNDRLGNAEPLPAIFPKGGAPAVILDDDGTRTLQNTHWGFVLPQVSKKTGKPIQPKAVNNARDDKLRTSRFWKPSFEARRCLIPATSFCEAKGRNPATYVWFGLEGDEDRPPFAFAGIWQRFQGDYGGEYRELVTSSIVTTTPNDLVRDTHPDRMPVILRPEDYDGWLVDSAEAAFKLIVPFPASAMTVHQQGEGLKLDRAWSDSSAA